MTDQPTPETDAAISVGLENADRECVPADFARRLERERDEAREALSRLQAAARFYIENPSSDTLLGLIKELEAAK